MQISLQRILSFIITTPQLKTELLTHTLIKCNNSYLLVIVVKICKLKRLINYIIVPIAIFRSNNLPSIFFFQHCQIQKFTIKNCRIKFSFLYLWSDSHNQRWYAYLEKNLIRLRKGNFRSNACLKTIYWLN